MAKLPEHVIANALEQDKSNIDVSFEEIDSFGDMDSMRNMFQNIANYNKMLNERITFINKDLTKAIPFTRENLYLMCAYSGNGKSTAAANISYPLWKEGKKTLVISNEEPEQDIVYRIACLELGYNFNDYKKGQMPLANQKECVKLFPEITKYVKIIDVNAKEGISTKLEGIKNILEVVNNKDYSCVMIDYYQLIRKSIANPSASPYEVLNDLRIFFGQYIKRANIPIVIFAQLHSLGKRNNKDLDSRIKMGPEIYETATVVLEMIPNFEDKTSDFLIVKDRFGLAGNRLTFAFDRGRYIPMDPEAIAKRQQEEVKEIEEKVNAEGAT
jgi:predicted ATP-dependent serine protease